MKNCNLCYRQFSAAEGSDLWNNIQIAINQSYPNVLPEGLTVPFIMETWELQAGYPVVNVIRDYDNKQVVISQVCIRFNCSNVI